ncbi:carbon-phosphorus lyase complex subunit PhnI [Streptomyces melanosporofaciens]|uniref:carbon-phosphorus lyase complex subunit PhnI n=1 Tax=unclassified Streptomyces TaxID=2593676 RepID=UPI0036C680FD
MITPAPAPASAAAVHAEEPAWLELDQLTERLNLAVDRAMGEAGLWAPKLAARAVRQAEGDPTEAAHLLRAHRAALPRLAVSVPVATSELRVVRRISSAFRNPPGGQILGRTVDYAGRLLDLLPEDEGRAHVTDEPLAPAADGHLHHDHDHQHEHSADPVAVERVPGNVLAILREMGLVAPLPERPDDPEPYDITRRPARPGAPRSAWLQTMARGDTGSLVHLWWYGCDWRPDHEIPGELRHGALPVRIAHPHTGKPVTVAEVRVSEVESFYNVPRAAAQHHLGVGYGICFGHNERKSIAMAGLDLALAHYDATSELHHDVLLTLDGLDSTGYVQHLKLPHHVEYRSVLDRAEAAGQDANPPGETA